MSPAGSGGLYIESSQEIIKNKLSREDYEAYIKIRDLSRTGTNLARQSHLKDSRECFQQAYDFMEMHDSTEELDLLGKSRIMQGEAFLEFLLNDFNRVRSLVETSLECDRVLESRYKYHIFHIQRLHQLHLLMRADVACGEPSAALELADQTTRYLIGDQDSLPVGEGWGKKILEKTPLVFRFAMATRIASEVGTILARHTIPEGRELAPRFSAWKLCSGHKKLEEIHEWGKAKEKFLREDFMGFLEECAAFLERGRRDTSFEISFTSCSSFQLHISRLSLSQI